MNILPQRYVDQSMTYAQYLQRMLTVVEEGSANTLGYNPGMLQFTQLNNSRMRRLDKKANLTEATLMRLQSIDRQVLLLTLTEGWCGDAAQILPVLENMATANSVLSTGYLLRDEHPDLMDGFLTNGARAIPVTVFVELPTRKILGHWGPRPRQLQEMVMDAKRSREAIQDPSEKAAVYANFQITMQKWYNADKGQSTQRELLDALLESLNQ